MAHSTVRIFYANAAFAGIRVGTRFVRQVTREIEEGAQLIAGHGPYVTGELARSIRSRGPIVLDLTVSGSVGSHLAYSAAVESGAKIHAIFPRRSLGYYRFGKVRAPALRFYWAKAGRVAVFNQIPGALSTLGLSHPGQKGKGYLIRPFGRAVIKYRMRIIASSKIVSF